MADLESVAALARRLDQDFGRAKLRDEGRILKALLELVESGVPRTVVQIHGEPITYEEACAYLHALSTHPTAWPHLELDHLESQEWQRRLTAFADALAVYARERGLRVTRGSSRVATPP